VTVYFSEIIEILKKYTTFLGDFSTVKVIWYMAYALGYILGDFFTNIHIYLVTLVGG
jgi:hypothetical protein